MILWFLPATAWGAYISALGSTGMMMQPTSSYFHLVYGGVVETGIDSQKLVMRLGYLERPAFKVAGFSDQEFASYGLIGTTAYSGRRTALLALVGWGEASGIVERDPAPSSIGGRRRYSLPGPAVNVTYRIEWKGLVVALAHQIIVGFGDVNQTNAFVVWPFSFVLIDLGWKF